MNRLAHSLVDTAKEFGWAALANVSAITVSVLCSWTATGFEPLPHKIDPHAYHSLLSEIASWFGFIATMGVYFRWRFKRFVAEQQSADWK